MGPFTRIACVLALSLSFMAPAASEEPDAPDPWAPIRVLLGRWHGIGSGFGGVSEVFHTYEFVIQHNFIHSTTVSRFQPKDDGTPSEIHEDWGMFSFDSDRDTIVFRQFLSEGFVNTYVMDASEADSGVLVFTSESTEGAGGMAARLTFSFENDDRYHMVLELAPPGKDFFACQTLDMERTIED
jgi:hypothetical protein